MSVWVLSEDDLKSHSKYGEIPLKQVLWDYGMDVNQDYEIDNRHLKQNDLPEELSDTSEHEQFGYGFRSPFTNKIQYCTVYRGVGRSDTREWRRVISTFNETTIHSL